MKKAITLAAVLLLAAALFAQTAITPGSVNHTYYANQFGSIQSAITAAGTTGSVVIPASYTGSDVYTNPNLIHIWDMRISSQTAAPGAAGLANSLYLKKINNTPWTCCAGILNNYLDPMVRFDLLNSQTQKRSGSQMVLLLNQPNAYGINYAGLTAPITANASPQSVAVDDSSWIQVGDSLVVGINRGGSITETVTVTGTVDSTHFSGIFTHNHISGELIHPAGFNGYKSSFGIATSDHPSAKIDLDNGNPNVVCNGVSGAQCVGWEPDITNNTGIRAATWYGEDNTHRYIEGMTMLILGGANPAGTTGIDIRTGDGVGMYRNGIALEGASQQNGFLITTGGTNANRPVNGYNVQAASGAGYLCGSNQTPATAPVYSLFDPTDCFYLTAQGNGASASSNLLTFEETVSSATHRGSFQLVSQQLRYLYDRTWAGSAFDQDGGISSQGVGFRIRNGSNQTVASLTNSGNNATLAFNAGLPGTLTIVSTTENVANLAINGDTTMTAAPRMAVANFIPSISTVGTLGMIMVTEKPITITRIILNSQTPAAGCATFPVVSVFDNTGSAILTSVTIGTGNVSDGGAVAVNVASAKQLVFRTTTAAVTCGTNAANVNMVMQYKMQ